MIPSSVLIQGGQGSGKSRLMSEMVCSCDSISKTKVVDPQTFILTPFRELKTDILYLIEEVEGSTQLEAILEALDLTKVQCLATSQMPMLDILRVTCFSDRAKYLAVIAL